ncbi:MAG TPA: ATP-binding protein [Polyangiaceae bacterium]|nr:ATP-binding protein [Polyangiaceae bacterium]
MLLQFRVENHRSLRDEQQLSLAASALGHDDSYRLLRPKAISEAILPAVAIYGANASGKSNVLHALRFMRDAVLLSYRSWEPETGVPVEPFALSQKRMAPSFYEVEIIANDVRFRYGFVIGRNRVEEEWLFAWPHGHKQTWFEREGDSFKFGGNLHGDNEAIRGLTRDNSLFLSVAAQNNHAALMTVFRWFRGIQVTARRGSTAHPANAIANMFSRHLSLFGEEESLNDRKALLDLLQAADTGIVDMRVDEAEPDAPGFRRRTRLEFRHKAEIELGDRDAWLPLSVESAGTVALVDLGPRLTRSLRSGGLLCIDEMEASLHPMLALSILNLFQDPERNPNGAQLLFTTHDTDLLGTILGSPPLRRDQIWFTEKDDAGASHLYPLTDFRPRKQENLERGYLQGRYGAIPFLGSLVPESSVTDDKSE